MNFKTVFAVAMLSATLAGTSMAADKFLADKHAAKGMNCQMCHGPDKNNLQEPTTATCVQCHPVNALVSKTAKVKPTNPHTSPHYATDLDCSSCHLGHQAGENFCNQCHQFNFNVK